MPILPMPVSSISMEDRFTLCNMGVETGAKAAIMPFDGVTEAWINDRLGERALGPCKPASADQGARYDKTLAVDLSSLTPMLGVPHRVEMFTPSKITRGVPSIWRS